MKLTFSTTSEFVRLPSEAVVSVTADGNYSTITTVDGAQYVLTLQLGQVERRISEMLEQNDNRFIRIGKSLIVNCIYITLINPNRQRLVLSDGKNFRHEVSASKDALKSLKEFVESMEETI